MKIKWDENTTTKTLSNLAVVTGGLIIYFIFQNLSGIKAGINHVFGLLTPFVYGFVIAYLLCSPMNFFEKKVFLKLFKKKPRPKLARALSIIITLILAFAILITLISFLVPQLGESIMTFRDNLPGYAKSLTNMVNDIAAKFNLDSTFFEKFVMSYQELISKVTTLVTQAVPHVVDFSMKFTSQIFNVIVGLFISLYFLAGKEKFIAQLKKVMYAVLPKRFVESTLEIASMSNRTFSRYVSGQLMDAAVVGCLCFLGLTILKMPFALLISCIVMVTNVIPMVGPFIGAIPGTFIILMSDGFTKALIFVVFIVILQQVDGNILVPKIIGESTGLSGFWVLFAIVVGGGQFGIVGIVIGVPVFSVLYTLIKRLIEKRLKQIGMSPRTNDYVPKS